MTTRYIQKLTVFGFLADRISKLSTCKRRQQGCIIVPCNCSSVYSVGYNGPPITESNDSCRDEEGNCGCSHAEINALLKYDRYKGGDSLIMCTQTPCEVCANAILNSPSIKGYISFELYRDTTGLDKLRKAIPVLTFDDVTGCAKGDSTYATLQQWWQFGRYSR